ncbi:MAG: Tm-1-like ATP-binding domain-containing protein, partial [Acidimicrobiia bacterium]
MSTKEILLIGALDTKGDEYRFVADLLREGGLGVLVADTGVLGDPQALTPDISSESIAQEAGTSLDELRASGDRGAAMTAMAEGVARTTRRLHEQGRIAGVLGMGGTGGTSVISAAMRELPIGFPKVLVSTAAAGDTRPIVGTRDVILIPSVVDVAGVNRISRLVFAEAAAAMVGLVNAATPDQEADKPIVAISMFGNTT